MNTLVFGYNVYDKNRNLAKISPNIQVDFRVKLVILNPSLTSPGVVDTSSTFYTTKLSMGNGFPVKEEFSGANKVVNKEMNPDAIKGSSSITMSLNMNNSTIFKNFWAKWSNIIPEGDSDRNRKYYANPAPNANFFALEVTQIFRGDVNYAGFSKVNYLPLIGFYNEKASSSEGVCNQKNCENPNFVFLDSNVDIINVFSLIFDEKLIIEKQIEAASVKINFEKDLENYQSQLIAQSLDLILSTADYQPNSFTKVITRLLEFHEGTLLTSLDYSNNANLTELSDLLTTLQTEIEDIAGLYPSITIEDGEGIPYGDGIPGSYEFFGWFYNDIDGFAITPQDGSTVTNYAIITQNNVEILDTRDYESSLSGFENFYPSDYITFPPVNTQIGDVFECTVYSTEYAGGDINFIHSNFGKEFDFVNTDINITRGLNEGLYNSAVESFWNENLSPSGTTWNSINTDSANYGFSNLDTVDSRTFDTFYNAIGESFSPENLTIPLIMYDEINDEYWTVKITSWSQDDEGGGFSYIRRLINQTGTPVTYKDILIWK
jgi:hypothetical protein